MFFIVNHIILLVVDKFSWFDSSLYPQLHNGHVPPSLPLDKDLTVDFMLPPDFAEYFIFPPWWRSAATLIQGWLRKAGVRRFLASGPSLGCHIYSLPNVSNSSASCLSCGCHHCTSLLALWHHISSLLCQRRHSVSQLCCGPHFSQLLHTLCHSSLWLFCQSHFPLSLRRDRCSPLKLCRGLRFTFCLPSLHCSHPVERSLNVQILGYPAGRGCHVVSLGESGAP